MIRVLLMSYGAPQNIDDLENFFSHILQGRTPSLEQLEPLREQYRLLGTNDPLSAVTARQAEVLQVLLQPSFSQELRVGATYKYSQPFIKEEVQQCIQDKASYIVVLPMLPLYSHSGVGQYLQTVNEALGDQATISTLDITSWHLHPKFVSVLVKRVKQALDWLSDSVQENSTVIFTTHSLPGTPEKHPEYTTQFVALAEKIAQELQLSSWRIAYRSARNKQGWLEPELKEVIREEAQAGKKGIVTCDLLSITANIEVIHELGTECMELTHELGLEYVHTEFLNDSADFMLALADIVLENLHALRKEEDET